MKVGTEDKKKTMLAAGLSLVALATVYVNFFSGGSAKPTRPSSARSAAAPQSKAAARPSPSRNVSAVSQPRSTRRTLSNDFQPIWRQSHEDEEFDPLKNDPTLRTDLLAAVRSVPMSPYSRNIFQFGERKRVVEPLSQAEIQKAAQRATPPPPPPPVAMRPEPAAPAKPTAPRITWKYYGFASPSGDGKRRAFLLDGENLLIGGEGDVFRERYKVKRVGLTSIVIEDMQFAEEQTLPITAPAT